MAKSKVPLFVKNGNFYFKKPHYSGQISANYKPHYIKDRTIWNRIIRESPVFIFLESDMTEDRCGEHIGNIYPCKKMRKNPYYLKRNYLPLLWFLIRACASKPRILQGIRFSSIFAKLMLFPLLNQYLRMLFKTSLPVKTTIVIIGKDFSCLQKLPIKHNTDGASVVCLFQVL